MTNNQTAEGDYQIAATFARDLDGDGALRLIDYLVTRFNDGAYEDDEPAFTDAQLRKLFSAGAIISDVRDERGQL